MATSVIQGVRNEEFRSHIGNILKRAKLSDEIMDVLLSQESMTVYDKAFTSSTINELNNYEIFEQLGDVLIGSFIVWYSYKRFPQLNNSGGFKIVAVIKIKYGSEEILSAISDSLGLYNYISYSNQIKVQERHKLLEDVFEAFIGSTAYILDEKYQVGVGYHVCYNILKALFDELHISLEYEFLTSPVTRLKELGDDTNLKGMIGNLRYDTKTEQHKIAYDKFVNIHHVSVTSNKLGLLSESRGETIQKAKDSAAEMAIKRLRDMNPSISRPTPELWKRFSST